MAKKILKAAKKIIKIAVDAAMFALFLLLMEYRLLPAAAHEWLGISAFILFVAHNALNYRWYAVLFKGKYSAMRIIQTALDFLLIITVLLCMISALFVSREVFAGLNLQAGMFGRTLHMKASAWTFVLMSVHLGLHFGIFAGMIKKTNKRIEKKINIPALCKTVAIWAIRIAVLAAAVYGVVVFVQRGFYEELFVPEVFRGYFGEKTALAAFAFFLQTAAMSVTFASITYYAKKLGLYLKNKRARRSESAQN